MDDLRFLSSLFVDNDVMFVEIHGIARMSANTGEAF